MKGKYAADIRLGIETAKRYQYQRGFIILNSQHYSKLALWAFNTYRLRHWKDFNDQKE